MDRPPLAHVLDRASRGGLASLDVFGTVSEALHDLDLEIVRSFAAHLAVHPIASTTLKLEPQNSNVRATDKGRTQGISLDWSRCYVE